VYSQLSNKVINEIGMAVY